MMARPFAAPALQGSRPGIDRPGPGDRIRGAISAQAMLSKTARPPAIRPRTTGGRACFFFRRGWVS